VVWSCRGDFGLEIGDRWTNDGRDETLVEEQRRDLQQPRPRL